jgi:hypothetical protein
VTKWSVVFDGSTDPGTVVLEDGLIFTRARFETDGEAKLMAGMLRDLVDELRDAEDKLARILERIEVVKKEAAR